jgi:CDP-4-dehydro-6-deoxyglucose reductase
MEKRKALAVELVLTHRKQLTHDVFEQHFEPKIPFDFDPGQFVSIIVPGKGPGGRDLRRAYSIASGPELVRNGKSVLELCVKLVEGGPGTTYLNSMKVGDVLNGMAPYGDFTYKTKPNRHAIFISTGTGIAPFRAMVQSQVYQNQKPITTTLLFGGREVHDLLYVDELNHSLGKQHFVKVLSKTKEEFDGFRGRVTDWMRHHADKIHWRETDFYICGNGAMIDEVKSILAAHEVEKTSIHQEVYYKPKAGETHASQN